MSQSQTTVVSLQQLAELADLEPRFFYRHRDELPRSIPVHNGTPGRPQLHYEISDIIEFILSRTGFMSEVELRIRAALAPEKSRRPKCAPRIIDTDHGHIVVPTELDKLPADERATYLDVLERERTELRNRRAKRTATHATNTTEE